MYELLTISSKLLICFSYFIILLRHLRHKELIEGVPYLMLAIAYAVAIL